LPYLLTLHDEPVRVARMTGSAYRWVRAAVAWHVMRGCRHVTAVSPYLKEELQHRVPADIVVIPNPVADLAFELLDHDPRQVPRVGMVCNGWGPIKNGERALQAFAQVRRQMPELELWVWGQDFERGGKAARWATAQGLDAGVQFKGALPHAELLTGLSACQVLLHPSLEESFGLVVAEAMAMGLPVVGGHHSGAVPWVLGSAGLLVDVASPRQMAQTLFDLLRDSERRLALSKQASARARSQFSVQAVVDAYVNQYHQVLVGGSQGGTL